ncbi:MAG: cellulase family glycosylhydrolase [Bacteroidales bacterium]|nr:cellulase family glycosylhydrolase [Bacteroidales bacterium]
MRKKGTTKLLFALIIFIFFNAGCAQKTEDYVTVDGNRFMYKGQPYYFFGINIWQAAYLGADLNTGNKERLTRELDELAQYGITNLRILAHSEESSLKMSVSPAFQTQPGVYNEQLLEGLDYALAEMGKRGMKAILMLNNYWQWSGGMSQYVNWTTGIPVIDPDESGDWGGFMAASATFYQDSLANNLYRDYIRILVTRTNTITGVQYKNDPAIMTWELANEPRPAPSAGNNPLLREAFYNWVDQTAQYIKSLDNNHLVTTGSEGTWGSLVSEEICFNEHNFASIDYLTFHIWPKNWRWFDAKNPEATFNQTMENVLVYFNQHLQIARKLNKPAVLEEFGLERDYGSFSPDTSTTYRDKFLTTIVQTIVDSARAGAPIAGFNYWAWGGQAIAANSDYWWREGDTFMGDPPQEAQGLNSIFSTDTSTLGIFVKYKDFISKP